MRPQREIWDEAAATAYDTPGRGMFATELIEATTAALAELAEGGPALEFAIGTGRVAVPLAGRGVPVAGIELSPDMVAQLRTKADEATIPVTVGDMTTTRVARQFALVFLVFNTIGNLYTQAEQVACFRNAAAHLRPGGRFVVEMWVPQLRELPPGRRSVVNEVAPGYIIVDTYDVVQQHVVSHHVRFSADGRSPEATVTFGPARYCWPSELDLMGQLAGFELEARWSDWERTPFTAHSPSHVSVYRLTGAPVGTASDR